MEFNLASALPILERTPATLRTLLAGLPSEWTEPNEGPDTWSAQLIVAHLIHGERTDWIVRVRLILDQGPNRRFTPFDRRGHYDLAERKSINALLDDFATARQESLRIVRSWQLTDAQLDLQGEHPEFGAVSLRQLLSTWVAHDLGHIAQIARVMAKQYKEAVGPWVAYLPVLTRR
jgi:hypothetical protein